MGEELTREVYWAADSPDAYFASAMLEDADIRTIVVGEMLQGGAGEIQMGPAAAPTVRVAESQEHEALALIEAWVASRKVANRSVWTCVRCGEEVHGSFDVCWNCESLRGDAELRDVAAEPSPDSPRLVLGPLRAVLISLVYAGVVLSVPFVAKAVGLSDGIPTVLAAFAGALALWLVSRRFLNGAHAEPMRRNLGLRAPRLAWWAIAWMAAGFIGSILMLGDEFTVTAPSAHDQWLTEIAAGSPVGSALGLLVVFLVTPMAHEFLFRGILQTSMVARFGRPFAIFSVALLFTVLHAVSRTHDVAGIAAVATGAVVLGGMREYSGSIFPGVLANSLMVWLWLAPTVFKLG